MKQQKLVGGFQQLTKVPGSNHHSNDLFLFIIESLGAIKSN